MPHQSALAPGVEDVQAVETARRELAAARQWFDWVSDPGLVDEAVFRLRAAEMRLVHALTPLREHARDASLP